MIDRIVTKHPFLVIFLVTLGLVGEIIFIRIGSREMTVFIVSFLIFVSAFFAEQDKSPSRDTSESGKGIAQEGEMTGQSQLTRDKRYQSIRGRTLVKAHPMYPNIR